MLPAFVLLISTLVLRAAGRLGIKQLASWREAARVGLAITFLFSGATHFSEMRHDYAAMIPPPLPPSIELIYLTGVLEIAGAIGLLIPRLRRIAAVCLVLLLIALFPANVNAALNGIPFRGEPPTPLWLRLPVQLLYIGVVWWTSIRPSPRAASPTGQPQPA